MTKLPEHEPEPFLAGDRARLERELRIRDAERLSIATGLAEARADVERIAVSRAWRWGHGVAVLLARLSRRPVRTRGAVARVLERLARLERLIDAPDAARLSSHNDRASFCIKLAAANREAAQFGGDFHFATAVGRELERRGHHVRVEVVPEEENRAAEVEDVVIVLRGRTRYTPRATQLNVLWVISHPDELTGAECEGYDLVCVASERFAETLSAQTSTPVIVLEQATSPELFHPCRESDEMHELVFVGNSRGVRRKMLCDLLPTERRLAIYGTGWTGAVDARHLAARHVPNDQLHKVYSSAALVLNDHWEDMRAHGFISNRVYDAVACGAVVISDHVDGIEKRFGGAVLTYETREQLAQLIESLLADAPGRAARGAAGRDRILAAHTFAHRVETLLQAAGQRASEIGFSGHIGPIDDARG